MSLTRDADAPTGPTPHQPQESLDVAQMSVIPIGEVRYLKPNPQSEKSASLILIYDLDRHHILRGK